ncbi:hypothetical protein N0V90_002690 [Kalmusia sp. IMI 367209]|nr:hypothetical protein N0V90_002690 [Kalmusia sp. IMI 367209]
MDDMENEDIAAAMGFSSFGGTKKRKYDQTTSPKAKVDASGANTTRLGVRTKLEPEAGNDLEYPSDAVDTINSSRASKSDSTSIKIQTKQKQPAAAGLAAFLNRGQELPERPAQGGVDQATAPLSEDYPDATWTVSFGGPAISRAELAALRNGVRDENGDNAYFLPSFVEDPWERSIKGRK